MEDIDMGGAAPNKHLTPPTGHEDLQSDLVDWAIGCFALGAILQSYLHGVPDLCCLELIWSTSVQVTASSI